MARLLLAVFVAAAGAGVAVSFRKISHLGLCILISFAAGALLAVALFDIFPEVIGLVGVRGGAISILSGYLLFFIITKFVFHICPACAATHTELNFKAITGAMLTALSVHSFMDGLAIYSGSLTTVPVGMLVLVAVAYHKFPEGMALALVARESGRSRRDSFLISFGLESITTLAGGIAGWLVIVPTSFKWIGYVLGHAGGGFVFLVIHALLSEVIKHHPLSTVIAAFAGAASIGLVAYYIGAF